MRIISKFHDYYDGVMAHGTDKELVYVREQKVRQVEGVWVDFFEKINKWICGVPSQYIIEPGIVLFCGKQFPFFRLIFDEFITKNKPVIMYPYDIKNMDMFVNQTYTKYMLDEYYGTNLTGRNRTHKRSGTMRNRDIYRKGFEKFFATRPFKQHDVDELHHIERSPAIIIEQNRIKGFDLWGFGYSEIVTINPCLKDVEFYKIINAFTAFQEISMFLGGVLGVGVPKMVAVSDVIRAHKHGMDKTSFRMPSPGDRKFRRRNV